MPTPNFDHEQNLWRQGFARVAGIDEAGRGALAGPVVAAAVIAPIYAEYTGVWASVRDSKQLSASQREALAAEIQQHAIGWAIGEASAAVIDRENITVATRIAMQQAVQNIQPPPDHLLIDWVKLPHVNIHQISLTKADQKIVSVAAASILAKVYRDRLMIELDAQYPAYGFAQHKGYGTAAHRAAIAQHGPCAIHRHTFAPIATQHSLFDLSADTL
ncbi:MAG: ribonuclease HII [Caldilineaceae bacterium]